MSSAWLLDPRDALLVVLALVALSYIVLVARATSRGRREGDGKTIHLWARHVDGALAMDATATVA